MALRSHCSDVSAAPAPAALRLCRLSDLLARAARMDHPGADQLTRFARGEASAAESRTIVRHLLWGCRTCGGKILAEATTCAVVAG